MKWLSERISSHRHEDYTTVIVSSKIEKWKETEKTEKRGNKNKKNGKKYTKNKIKED